MKNDELKRHHVHILMGNPLIANATDPDNIQKYELICRAVNDVPTIQDLTLDNIGLKMQVRGRKKSYKYPKAGASMQWVLNKIASVDAAVLEQLEKAEIKRDTPDNFLRAVKLGEEIIAQGGTVTKEIIEVKTCLNPWRKPDQMPFYEQKQVENYVFKIGTFKGHIEVCPDFKHFTLMMDGLLQKSAEKERERKEREILLKIAKEHGIKL